MSEMKSLILLAEGVLIAGIPIGLLKLRSRQSEVDDPSPGAEDAKQSMPSAREGHRDPDNPTE